MSFPTAQQVNLPACSPHCPFIAVAAKASNATTQLPSLNNTTQATLTFVIGLARLEIKPKFTSPEADALTTRSSELLISFLWRMKETVLGYWENGSIYPVVFHIYRLTSAPIISLLGEWCCPNCAY